MKTFAIQPTLAAIAALAFGFSINAQPAAAEEKQPAPSAQKQPAGGPAQASTKTPEQNRGGLAPATSAPKPAPQPSPPAETTENNAAVAAAARQPLLSQPDSPVISDKKLPGAVRVASKDIDHQSAHALNGRKVRGRDGETLGKIKDFLIDAPSGGVTYAVISSSHDKLRLVPFRALKPDQAHRGDFSVIIAETEWSALGALDEAAFKSGYVTVSDGERRILAQRFEAAQSGEAAPAFYTQDISSHLTRADFLRGRTVFVTGNRKIGTIQEVIIHRESATASALFHPSWQLTSAKEKFVVPLNRYSFGSAKDERVVTVLTRDDFDAMGAITHQAVASGPTPPPAPSVAPSPVPAASVTKNPR